MSVELMGNLVSLLVLRVNPIAIDLDHDSLLHLGTDDDSGFRSHWERWLFGIRKMRLEASDVGSVSLDLMCCLELIRKMLHLQDIQFLTHILQFFRQFLSIELRESDVVFESFHIQILIQLKSSS